MLAWKMSTFGPCLGDTLLDDFSDDLLAALGLLETMATFEEVTVAIGRLQVSKKNILASVCEVPILNHSTNHR
jgi:hypothetical protein